MADSPPRDGSPHSLSITSKRRAKGEGQKGTSLIVGGSKRASLILRGSRSGVGAYRNPTRSSSLFRLLAMDCRVAVNREEEPVLAPRAHSAIHRLKQSGMSPLESPSP